MKQAEIDFLFEVVQTEKNGYHYFKDKYALNLLQFAIDGNIDIGRLKNSRWKFLLEKPSVKTVLASCGNGKISTADLAYHYQENSLGFTYSLATWGSCKKKRVGNWHQTTRPEQNVVLQLNFDSQHNHALHEYVLKQLDWNPFIESAHPVKTTGGHTLGWCRLDYNLETGEALIEEIQNDWLRNVIELEKDRQSRFTIFKEHWFFEDVNPEQFKRYADYLKPYFKLWDEALLNLGITFIKEELGINTIYMHEFESGNAIKCLPKGYQPPRSLYTVLPKKFGFSLQDETPQFIEPDRLLRKVSTKKPLNWWKLDFTEKLN